MKYEVTRGSFRTKTATLSAKEKEDPDAYTNYNTDAETILRFLCAEIPNKTMLRVKVLLNEIRER